MMGYIRVSNLAHLQRRKMPLAVDQMDFCAELLVVSIPRKVGERLRFRLASQIDNAVNIAISQFGAGFMRWRNRSI